MKLPPGKKTPLQQKFPGVTAAVVLGIVLVLAILPASATIVAGSSRMDSGSAACSSGTGSLPCLASPPVAIIAGDDVIRTAGSTGVFFESLPGTILSLQPLPIAIPTRNRTPVIQTIVKNAAERPKVTLPLAWIVLLFLFAAGGIAALFYVLFFRKTRAPVKARKDPVRTPPEVTVIGQPVPVNHPGTPEKPGPDIQFPPSLEKRFSNAEFIGEGGLARVFRAFNAKSGKTVAVKVPIRFDEITGTHFTRDIMFWQGLHHKNIVEIYSSNILPVPYIEMEYAGRSLAEMHLPLPEDQAIRIVTGVAEGIAYAHAHGIVHRDIKPENILIAADGTPKITDWGLGRAAWDPRKSSIIGFSPSYAAPEQIAPRLFGQPGPGTDIYQLGMLLYEMVTGAPVFGSGTMPDLSHAILYEKPVLHPWAGNNSRRIIPIITRCLEKKQEARYPSVEDFIRDLSALG